jgi:hypothetical protein
MMIATANRDLPTRIFVMALGHSINHVVRECRTDFKTSLQQETLGALPAA